MVGFSDILNIVQAEDPWIMKDKLIDVKEL